jgi:dinuclear metal center YbgI/SA1388 family protein
VPRSAVSLDAVGAALQGLAPLERAEAWDNVGWIAVPTEPRPVGTILLTIDLTKAVAAEAIATGAGVVVAYHPPIFEGLTRLAATQPIVRLVEERIAVYSPHTALDAAEGGVNDWLADGIGSGRRTVPEGTTARRVALTKARTLDELVLRVKGHLGLERLRIAIAATAIRTVAVCAGAGGKALGPVAADLYVTGEMRHHDVLAAVARGTSVILAEHSNTERGYLPILRDRLEKALRGKVEVRIAASDREPLEIA